MAEYLQSTNPCQFPPSPLQQIEGVRTQERLLLAISEEQSMLLDTSIQ